jgi:hypothetical protein
MSLTQLEINLCNQALSQIGAAKVVLATQATANEGIAANDFYTQTRDSLLRSYYWPFARVRTTLSKIYTIEFDNMPGPSTFVVGDVITGVTSGAYATVLEVISDVEYKVAYLSGTFSDSETITNATVYPVAWQGIPVVYGTDSVVWYDGGSQVACGTGYPITTVVAPDFGYSNQYLLPIDFDRLVKRQSNYHHHHSTIEGNYLLTDSDNGHVLYIKKVTDTTLFDTLFVEILVMQLQLKFIPAIAGTNMPGTIDRIERRLSMVTARARAICEDEENNTGNSSWNNARFGSGKMMCRR